MVVKRISIFIILFSFLFSTIEIRLCSALEFGTAGKSQSSYLVGTYDSHHHAPPGHHNKTRCSDGHFCCNSIAQNLTSYAFILGSHLLDPVEMFFKPLLDAKLLYRPPQTHP